MDGEREREGEGGGGGRGGHCADGLRGTGDDWAEFEIIVKYWKIY